MKTYDVVFDPGAQEDALKAAEYIAQFAPVNAARHRKASFLVKSFGTIFTNHIGLFFVLRKRLELFGYSWFVTRLGERWGRNQKILFDFLE